jgi:hypothetical protein
MSKSRSRSIRQGLLVVLAISGIAVAPAFAEGPLWRVNGNKLTAGQLVKTAGKGTLSFVVSGLEFTVLCETLTDKTLIAGGDPGKDEDNLSYSNCMVVGELPTCSVTEPIAIESNTLLVYLIRKEAGQEWKKVTEREWELAPGRGEQRQYGDEFKPKTGSLLYKVKVNGSSCTWKGEYNASGTYRGLVNSGLEFSKETSDLLVNNKDAFATGFLEYWIVNGADERTGEDLLVGQ